MRTLLSLSLLLPSLTACYLSSDGQELERKVAALQARQDQLTTTLENSKGDLTNLVLRAEQEITRLQDMLSQSEDVLRRNNADLSAKVDQNGSDVAALRGQVEEAKHLIETLRQELELAKTDFTTQLSGAVVPPGATPPAPTPAPEPAAGRGRRR